MEARRRRDPTAGPVDSAEWLADLCASASLQIRRQRARSSAVGGSWSRQPHPNSACHDDGLDAESLSSGVLDAFSALHDSLASLLGDPDTVREVVERGGELFRLNRGLVAEACRRRRGRDQEGPAWNGDDNGQRGFSAVKSTGSGSLVS